MQLWGLAEQVLSLQGRRGRLEPFLSSRKPLGSLAKGLS